MRFQEKLDVISSLLCRKFCYTCWALSTSQLFSANTARTLYEPPYQAHTVHSISSSQRQVDHTSFCRVIKISTNLSRLFWIVVLSSRLCSTLSLWPWQYLQSHSSFPHAVPAITRFGSLHWSVTENIPLLLNSQENLIQINRNASNLSVSHCWLSATNNVNHSEWPVGYSTGMRRVKSTYKEYKALYILI